MFRERLEVTSALNRTVSSVNLVWLCDTIYSEAKKVCYSLAEVFEMHYILMLARKTKLENKQPRNRRMIVSNPYIIHSTFSNHGGILLQAKKSSTTLFSRVMEIFLITVYHTTRILLEQSLQRVQPPLSCHHRHSRPQSQYP